MSGYFMTEEKNELGLFKHIEELFKMVEGIHDVCCQHNNSIFKLSSIVEEQQSYLKKIDTIALCDPDKVVHNQKITESAIQELNKNFDEEIEGVYDKIAYLEQLIKLCQESIILSKAKELSIHDKKPYKCPVCDGTGSTRITDKTADGPRRHFIEHNPCGACAGNGFLWG